MRCCASSTPIPRHTQPPSTELGEPSRPVQTCTTANLGSAGSSNVSGDRRVMAPTPPTLRALGQLEASDRRYARLCHGPRFRDHDRVRPNRRRGRHQTLGDGDVGRTGRLALLGADAISRWRRIRHRDVVHRTVLHCRGSAGGGTHQPGCAERHLSRHRARRLTRSTRMSARATVRTRRWYLEQLTREINMQTQPLKLYLSEDFQRDCSRHC
jgi:hypothetical protein